jgi:hypothetical protein
MIPQTATQTTKVLVLERDQASLPGTGPHCRPWIRLRRAAQGAPRSWRGCGR